MLWDFTLSCSRHRKGSQEEATESWADRLVALLRSATHMKVKVGGSGQGKDIKNTKIYAYFPLFCQLNNKNSILLKAIYRFNAKWKLLSCLFVTAWTVACQDPLSVEFSKQFYWSGLPFPSPGDFPNPGIKHRSPPLQVNFLPSEPPGKPRNTGVGSLSLLQGIFPTQVIWQGLHWIGPSWSHWGHVGVSLDRFNVNHIKLPMAFFSQN